MRFRRAAQGTSLLLFLLLLWLAASPVAERVRVDIFLRMDPLVVLGTTLSSRAFISLLLPGFIVAALTVMLGRFFCSWLCPMGTTIDITDRILKRFRMRPRGRLQILRRARAAKYVLLSFILGAALAGVSLVSFVSPASIATRLYGLVVYPVISSLTGMGIGTVRGAGSLIGLSLFEYTTIPVPTFSLQSVTVVLAAAIIGAGILAPRFWCRYLCPAGTVLAALSWRKALNRQVSDACTGCGACRKACPMDAIAEDFRRTGSSDCIVCGKCAEVCPAGAVRFSSRKGKGHGEGLSKDRRVFLLAGLSGAGAALLYTVLPGWAGRVRDGKYSLLVRPPGALPENAFRIRCVGCGECMKSCPTNTLQPAGLQAGITGFMSPVVVPRKGPCDTACFKCGLVCPTGALRSLGIDEKSRAKIGTAAVIKKKCIAWEEGRPCLVCDEVCPYGAVELEYTAGSKTAVPFVDEKRCNGCGLCEHACPVEGRSAIVVSPDGALRLEEGSYILAAKRAGYEFELKQPQEYGEPPRKGAGRLPPGFEN